MVAFILVAAILMILRMLLPAIGVARPARWQRNPLPARSKIEPRRILVTGATGFIGRHLCRRIIAAGDHPIVLTRDRARAADLYGPHATVCTSLDEIDAGCHIDAIVNLAGEPIFARRWTQSRRRTLLESRLHVTQALTHLVARLQHKPRVLLSMSAIGYYGVRGDEELTEADRGQPIFQSQLCQLWELAAQRARDYGVRVCCLRLGLVLGRDGGALPQQALVARMRLRTILGSGEQWVSWIHIDDLLRLCDHCIDRDDIDGAINATAPVPVRQHEFAAQLAAQFGAAVTLRAPAHWLTRTLGERAQLLVGGQRVLPMKAECADFTFEHCDLTSALAALCGSARTSGPSQILYDPLCPICDMEMYSYCRAAKRAGHRWQFDDVASRTELLGRYRLDLQTARKRVYLLDESGSMVSGMEAVCAIWAGLPYWRVLAAVMRLPLIRPAAAWFYDLILAPAIWHWNRRRRAATQTAMTGTH